MVGGTGGNMVWHRWKYGGMAQVKIWYGTGGNMVWHRWKYGMAQVEIWWSCDNRVSKVQVLNSFLFGPLIFGLDLTFGLWTWTFA